MNSDHEIKHVEDLLNKCLLEKDLKKKLELSKQIPDKVAAILKMSNLTAAHKAKINELSKKWMDMQGSIMKQLDGHVSQLKKQAASSANTAKKN